MSGARVVRRWRGDDILTRMKRATGSGLIAIAENVVAEGKRNAHVISGTMKRSIHAAPAGYDGGDDEIRAVSSDLPSVKTPSPHPVGWAVEAGSWMPYACVEEVGRGHQFMTPAVESVRGVKATAIMTAAFKRERL